MSVLLRVGRRWALSSCRFAPSSSTSARTCSSISGKDSPGENRVTSENAAKVDVDESLDDVLPPLRTRRPPIEQRGITQEGPQNILDQFHHEDFTSGLAARISDYEETRDRIASMQTVEEKVDAVNTYERNWTKAERRVWRLNHTPLYSPRKAWRLRCNPIGYDSLPFYQYVTKTAVVKCANLDDVEKRHEKWAEKYSQFYENVEIDDETKTAVTNRTREVLHQQLHLHEPLKSHRLPSARRRARQQFTAGLVQQMVQFVYARCVDAHEHLRCGRLHQDASLQSFWTRAGFQSLYDGDYAMGTSVTPWVDVENDRRITGASPGLCKLTCQMLNVMQCVKSHGLRLPPGDNLRLDGDLAFCLREKAPVLMMGRQPLPPVDTDCTVLEPLTAPGHDYGSHLWPYPPEMRPPSQYALEINFAQISDSPLYMQSGHDLTASPKVDPCHFAHTVFIDASDLVQRAKDDWRLEPSDESVLGESMMAGALAAGFSKCWVHAHAMGALAHAFTLFLRWTNWVLIILIA